MKRKAHRHQKIPNWGEKVDIDGTNLHKTALCLSVVPQKGDTIYANRKTSAIFGVQF